MLQRRLAAEAITCFVMEPGSLQVDRRARRAKTDRLDAAMLLRALMAWCRGDHAACRMVQVPSVEREDARRTHRERQRLIAERVQHVNRIKGLLAAQGIYTFQPLRRDRWERLNEVRTGDGRDLPQRLRGEIEREFRRLELVLEQVAAAEAERDAAVADPAVTDADAEKVARLARLGGIGIELATVLVRKELYRPFANRKQVAAYAGLTPSPYASGDRQRDQGISRLGTHSCGSRWSNWRGCGGSISRAAGSPAGSSSGSAPDAVASARSPRWRWRANCWSPCGAISPPGWFRRARLKAA